MYLHFMRTIFLSTLIFFGRFLFAQPATDTLLEGILKANRDTIFQQVLNDPQTYRLQIIYTQISRDNHNQPSFKNFYFDFDPDFYFNPASTVKLPLALLSLEKLNRMNVPDVNKYTPVQFDSSYEGQAILLKDSSSQSR